MHTVLPLLFVVGEKGWHLAVSEACSTSLTLSIGPRQQGFSSVLNIAPDHLRCCRLDLEERRNPGGVHCAYRAIRTFLYWWEQETEPANWTNPIRKVKAPRLSNDPLPAIPLDVIRALLATCKGKSFTDVRDKALLLALLGAGA